MKRKTMLEIKKYLYNRGGSVIWIKDSKFGSGRIHRRVYAIPETLVKESIEASRKMVERHKKNVERNEFLFKRSGNDKSSGKLKFETNSHYMIFKVWVSQKGIFAHHRPVISKTTSRAMNQITKALKKHSTPEIIAAIESCHSLFSRPDFKYYFAYTNYGFTLGDFFSYEKSNYESLVNKTAFKNIPRSWFEESLNGRKYLYDKYSFVPKDRNKPLTEALMVAWKKYQPNVSNINGPEKKSIFIRWSNYLSNWAKLNDFKDPFWLVDFICDALCKYKTLRITQLRFVQYQNFYSHLLPEALIKFNRSSYGDKVFVHNWKEITKK